MAATPPQSYDDAQCTVSLSSPPGTANLSAVQTASNVDIDKKFKPEMKQIEFVTEENLISLIQNTDWTEIDIFVDPDEKKINGRKMTLTLAEDEFVAKCVSTLRGKDDSDSELGAKLSRHQAPIPIIRSHGNGTDQIEFVYILRIEEQPIVDIGISLRCNAETASFAVSGIYVNRTIIINQHLLFTSFMNTHSKCDRLDYFVSCIDELIVNDIYEDVPEQTMVSMSNWDNASIGTLSVPTDWESDDSYYAEGDDAKDDQNEIYAAFSDNEDDNWGSAPNKEHFDLKYFEPGNYDYSQEEKVCPDLNVVESPDIFKNARDREEASTFSCIYENVGLNQVNDTVDQEWDVINNPESTPSIDHDAFSSLEVQTDWESDDE